MEDTEIGITSQSGVIKSASRTMAVLEAFQAWRRPATARELARELRIPRSSTNALLASLINLGYLSFESENNTYFPTLKVGLIGDWLIGSVRRDQALSKILQEISMRTGETVTIAVRAGFDVQFITIIPSTFPIALSIPDGTLAPLFDSAVGIAWLAAQPQDEVEALIKAYKRQTIGAKIDAKNVLGRIEKIANVGASVAYEKVMPDTGAIALAYPRQIQGQTIVIGVAGPEERIRRSEGQVISLVRRLARQTLG